MTANDPHNARTVQRGTILWPLLKLRDHFANHGERNMTGESPLSYQNSKQNTCTCYYLSVTQCKHMRRGLQLVSYLGARCGTSLTSGSRRFASLAVEQEAGWAPKHGMDFWGKRNLSYSYRNSNPRPPSPCPSRYTDYATGASWVRNASNVSLH